MAAVTIPASAGFDITTTRAPSTSDATKQVIRFFALNTGNGSGTRVQTGRVTITSISAPLTFQTGVDTNGDFENDVNVTGVAISVTNTGPAGSFIRFGQAQPGVIAETTPPYLGGPGFDPAPAFANLRSFTVDMAYLGTVTVPGGPDASVTPQHVATALVPIGTEVRFTATLRGDVGPEFQVSLNNVPEPATAGVMAIVGLGLLARRRGRIAMNAA
ncbi:PEP-CTERM sorting domain-containing protein [Humisphaera borealis]|uniref:PEP-CTERM sorting domain-containing protein n=1 Tax=Humisphaera borealis TaxID=2807512 RepID=A0A7M2WXR3_9BACT|nr:PEP-CTERM sorting domain-containing protein [Humisphaera borealis]QOV90317.1 PEP-CTERM sorting domain-containing protein [Humisphaera borealis]